MADMAQPAPHPLATHADDADEPVANNAPHVPDAADANIDDAPHAPNAPHAHNTPPVETTESLLANAANPPPVETTESLLARPPRAIGACLEDIKLVAVQLLQAAGGSLSSDTLTMLAERLIACIIEICLLQPPVVVAGRERWVVPRGKRAGIFDNAYVSQCPHETDTDWHSCIQRDGGERRQRCQRMEQNQVRESTRCCRYLLS